MERHRVIDLRADSALGQVRAQAVAIGRANHELIEDVERVRTLGGQHDRPRRRRLARRVGQRHFGAAGRVREQTAVARGVGAAGLGPRGEMRRFHPQHRGLQRIQPEIAADGLMVVLRFAAVIAHQSDARGERRVVRRHQSGVAERAEVLARKEREAAAVAERSGLTPAIGRADRLTCVFDHRDVARARDLQQRLHVDRLSVQVDRDDRFRTRRERAVQAPGGHVERHRIDVGQHRRGANARDAAGGGEERIGRGDDFVARTDAERHQRGEDRVGAGRYADRVGHAELRGSSRSSASTSAPRMKRWLSHTRVMAASTSSRSGAYCAVRSRRGTCMGGRWRWRELAGG